MSAVRKQQLSTFRITFAFVAVVVCYSATQTATAIDIGTTAGFHRQRFEAWGTSLAWMGNELGGSSNTFRRDQIMDLLFDQNNGLGLNFVRYNIGADQNPAGPAITRPGADIDGWVPTAPTDVSDPNTWVWDWNADATQRWVLDAAIKRGVTQVEAFANSAPWWMTNSLSSTGAPKVNGVGQNNLSTNNYAVFGEYLLDVSEHFESDLGIQFNTLSPMNEPGTTFWNGGSNQEGMNISPGSAQSALIREIGQQILDRGSEVGLVGPEETTIARTASSFAQWGSTTRSYLDRVNTHSYSYSWSSSDADAAIALADLVASRPSSTQTIYATEYGTGSASQPVNGGIKLANQIRSDLRHLKTPGWTYWQAVEDNNGSNWGLLIAPFDGNNNWFNMRRQYYAMQQFTSYIRPGAQILDQTNEETTAAYDPRTGTTTLVITNDDGTTDINDYDLLDQSAAFTRIIRTSDTESFKSLGPASVAGNQVSMSAPGNTISTLVIYHRPNLIQNADFHLGGSSSGASAIPGWQVQGGGFYNANNNSNVGSGSGALWTNNQANSGEAFQTGIGDAETDLTGMAFEFSLDVKFLNEGGDVYDADTYVGIEFYGADDQTLAHQSIDDFQTLIIPALGIDETRGTDSDYRTFRTARFIAPPGTRYVRPVIRYGNVASDSNNWVFFDNAYLQETHPVPDAREWTAEGSGDWSSSANWMSHALVENNSRRYFGNAIQDDSIVTLSGMENVMGLTFFSEHEYQLQGAGSLNIGSPGETALVDVRYGSHRIAVETSLAGAVQLQVLPNASLSFDSALDLNGQVLTKLGAGSLDLSSGIEMNGGQLAAYATADTLIFLGPAAILDGDFELLLAPGQDLQLGDLFTLVAYSSLNDTFDSLILPTISSNWAWDIDYGTSSLTVEIVDATIAGDFDADGDVDGGDFLFWQRNSLSSTELAKWQSNYAAGAPLAAQTTAVPEPSGLVITLVFSICLSVWSRDVTVIQ